jgi:hypothetical protein
MTKTIWAVVGVSVAVTVAMAVALVIVLSGGDDDDPEPQRTLAPPVSAGGGQAPGGAAPEELDEFRSCLEEEGVEPPSGGVAPSGDDLEALQDAFEKCREHLPDGAFVTPFNGGVPQN